MDAFQTDLGFNLKRSDLRGSDWVRTCSVLTSRPRLPLTFTLEHYTPVWGGRLHLHFPPFSDPFSLALSPMSSALAVTMLSAWFFSWGKLFSWGRWPGSLPLHSPASPPVAVARHPGERHLSPSLPLPANSRRFTFHSLFLVLLHVRLDGRVLKALI